LRICVVGAGSFIARALRAEPACAHWRWIDHRQALDWAAAVSAGTASPDVTDATDATATAPHHPLDTADVVLNCAFDPRLRQADDPQGVDIDACLARALARRGPAAGGRPEGLGGGVGGGVGGGGGGGAAGPGHPPSADLPHYVMLSTRLVWGQAGPGEGTRRLDVARPAAPVGPYAAAKWRAEQAVMAALPGRCTVLRLANIFGAEAADDLPGRRTFFAQALRSLREHGTIRLDISPFVERDFLPVEPLAAWLARIVPARRAGLWGLGSGQATPVGRIAQWLIEGHGRGRLEISDLREHDGFVIDAQPLHTAFALPRPADLQTLLAERCRTLGAGLAG
jgi:dTDP-4-dehydrorhamnose reductase